MVEHATERRSGRMSVRYTPDSGAYGGLEEKRRTRRQEMNEEKPSKRTSAVSVQDLEVPDPLVRRVRLGKVPRDRPEDPARARPAEGVVQFRSADGRAQNRWTGVGGSRVGGAELGRDTVLVKKVRAV